MSVRPDTVCGMALSIGMVTVDCADPQSLAGFWTAALGTTVARDYGEFVLLAGTPAVGLQKVPEYTDDRAAEVARLTALGASTLAERAAPGLWWTVMADPESNEFCVISRHG